MRRQLPKDQWTKAEEVSRRPREMRNSIFKHLFYNRMYATSLHTSKKRIRRTRNVPLGTIWMSRLFARPFIRFLYPTLDWTNTPCSWNSLPKQFIPPIPTAFLLKWKKERNSAWRIKGSRGWSIGHFSTTKFNVSNSPRQFRRTGTIIQSPNET
jgi:hypothetical protein